MVPPEGAVDPYAPTLEIDGLDCPDDRLQKDLVFRLVEKLFGDGRFSRILGITVVVRAPLFRHAQPGARP
jgi:hypothetical protein